MKNNILNIVRNYKFAIVALTALSLAGWSSESSAQVLYSTAGSSYGQDFNTLATTGGSTTWANNSTLTGWSLFSTASSSTPVTTIAIGDGTVTTKEWQGGKINRKLEARIRTGIAVGGGSPGFQNA